MANITGYFKEVKTEMKKVDWPSRKQAGKYALAIIIVSLIAGAFLGVLDFVFTSLLERFILY
jgi:preprotein translocase subunit SecE